MYTQLLTGDQVISVQEKEGQYPSGLLLQFDGKAAPPELTNEFSAVIRTSTTALERQITDATGL